MYPFPAPLGLQPDDAPPPGNSSFAPTFPCQYASPAQRVQQKTLLQSHENAYPIPICNEIPSAEQHTAIANLQQLPDATIFACLKEFRSFNPGEQWFHLTCLSHQQRQAISALKDCSDDLVFLWLYSARSHGSLHASQSLHRNSNLSNDTTAANPLGQSPSSYSDHFILTGPRSPRDQVSDNLSRGASVGEQSSLSVTPNDHIHWCITCKNPRAIKTCGGFKRHMREHQTRFYCIPQGPVLPTENESKCAFCDVPNPDSRHLNIHNVKLCVKKLPAARSYPRRDLFINHLKKKHDVANGSVLADQWKYTIHQKFFACGFCVSWFDSLNEQVNHIDAAHYRLSKHIRDWDFDKVIRSLLSRPGMNEHWQRVMAANPRFQESLFSWNPTRAEQLQRRLEMSQEPEDVLCRAAINESSYGRSQHGLVESVPVTGLTGLEMDTSQLMQTSQHQNVWSPLPSNQNQDSTAHAPPMTTPTLQSQQLGWNWEDHNNWNWNGTYGSRAVPQIASATDAAQSWKGHIGTSHSSRLGGYSQGVSSNISHDPRSRQGVETRTHPAQARTSGFPPTLSTQHTLLPFSRVHPTSHSGHILGPFNPAYHSTSVTQPQGQDLTDHHRTDVDDDFNNMQRPIQDQGDSRRQRRPH